MRTQSSGIALSLRDAVAADLPALAALALRSKGHWGYEPALLEAMRAELSWDEDELAAMCFRIGESGDALVGFSAVAPLPDGRGELEALFVVPEHIGSGAGRALMADAVEQARRLGYPCLVIQSDPNAERFYLVAGARRVGSRPSESIPGRDLPLLELDLTR